MMSLLVAVGVSAAPAFAETTATSMPLLAAAGEASHTGEVLSPINKGLVTAITTLIVFLTLLFILSKLAFGPIAASLKKREDKIRQDIADAEAARVKAENALKELTARLNAAEAEARSITTRATADAEKIGIALKARVQSEVEEMKERAVKEIDTAKTAAVSEVHEHAVLLSTSVAEKILRRSITVDDQRELIRASLEQLQNVRSN